MKRLFFSFSGFCSLYASNPEAFQDTPDCLYFFGTTKEATEQHYTKIALKQGKHEDAIKALLLKAENEGRVSWKVKGGDTSSKERFDWLVNKLGRPDLTPKDEDYEWYSASWNIPAFQEYHAKHLPEVTLFVY
jgi:hypothetical protein